MLSKTELMNKAVGTARKVGFQLKKHSPEILIVGGVVGAVTSTVMACKATMQVNDILDEAKADLAKVHEMREIAENNKKYAERYPEEMANRDTAIVYFQTGLKLAKLYAPSVILGVLSIGAILTSNNILRKRNVALASAYMAVDKSFKEYRGRVVERFGEEMDRELRHNIRAMEIEETVVNEDGTESTVKKTVEVADAPDISEFARFYDDGCRGWEKDPEYNLQFLLKQQKLELKK